MQQEVSRCSQVGQYSQGEGRDAEPRARFLAGVAGEADREAGEAGLEAQVITALTTQAGQVPEWVRLLPLGEVPLGDDREPLWVDQEALAAMVAHFQERGLDLVVDYEHQTLSGSKAPAAGWIRELEIRIAGETPAPQDGLWARVEWTATAQQHLAAREYRYFSPVLRLEDKTRRPLALLHAALTNTPAMNGLTPLVAKERSSQQVSGSRQRGGEAAAARGQGLEPLEDLAGLLGLPEDAGASRVLGAVLALKGNLEHLQGVQEELAGLKEELATQLVQAEVKAAIKAGKVLPCQKEGALRFASLDLESFRTFVAKAQPQIHFGPLNLGPDREEDRSPDQGLTPQQLLICQKLGLAPDAFKARQTHLQQENLL